MPQPAMPDNFSLHPWSMLFRVLPLPRLRLGVFRENMPRMFSGTEKLVEPIGIEPMTPCLQSRCSPS